MRFVLCIASMNTKNTDGYRVQLFGPSTVNLSTHREWSQHPLGLA
jgi:hypothetical protein